VERDRQPKEGNFCRPTARVGGSLLKIKKLAWESERDQRENTGVTLGSEGI